MMYRCFGCEGNGQVGGCPTCGRTIPAPTPSMLAMNAASERLQEHFRAPGMVIYPDEVRVWVGGEIIARATVTGPDEASRCAAIAEAYRIAMTRAHELADLARDPDAVVDALELGRVA